MAPGFRCSRMLGRVVPLPNSRTPRPAHPNRAPSIRRKSPPLALFPRIPRRLQDTADVLFRISEVASLKISEDLRSSVCLTGHLVAAVEGGHDDVPALTAIRVVAVVEQHPTVDAVVVGINLRHPTRLSRRIQVHGRNFPRLTAQKNRYVCQRLPRENGTYDRATPPISCNAPRPSWGTSRAVPTTCPEQRKQPDTEVTTGYIEEPQHPHNACSQHVFAGHDVTDEIGSPQLPS